MKRNNRRRRWLLLLVILLGFAWRVHDLEKQSMWSDEGLTLYRARQATDVILDNTITIDGIESKDTNPPLYFWLLHGWRALVGEELFNLRYFGVVAALLAVPLMYVTGKTVVGRPSGIVAAFLMALSPFHVWQTQVLRNYGLLITLNLFSIYGLYRFLLATNRSRQFLWLAVWLVAGLAGVYTHYFGFFILAYGILSVVVMIGYRWRTAVFKQWRIWLIPLIAGLLIMPAIPVAVERFRAGTQVDFRYVPLNNLISHALGAFSVGISPTLLQTWPRILPALILAFLGLGVCWLRNRKGAILLLGYQIVPLGLLQLFSLVNPLYNGARHLLIGLPPYLLLAAAGADIPAVRPLWRKMGQFWGIILVIVQAAWLFNQFNNVRFVRDDIKSAAQYLTGAASENDIIILHDTIIGFTFDYYYQGRALWQAIPQIGQRNAAKVTEQLDQSGLQAEHIWFMTQPQPRNGFPRDVLPDWAAENWTRFYSQQFPHLWLPVRLEGYIASDVWPSLPPDGQALAVSWDGMPSLKGIRLQNQHPVDTPTVWFDLFWHGHLPENMRVNLHFSLVGPDRKEWAAWDAPLNTQSWKSDSLIERSYSLSLPWGLPPGDYTLFVQPISLETGAPIGEPQSLTPLKTAPMSHWLVQPERPSSAGSLVYANGLSLAAFSLNDKNVRPGHTLPIQFYWQTSQALSGNYRLELALLRDDGTVWKSKEFGIGADWLENWPVDSPISQPDGFYFPPDTPPGQYRLSWRVWDGDAVVKGRPSWRPWFQENNVLGEIEVLPWPLITEPPAGIPVLSARFGENITLYGYQLQQTETELTVSLYWQTQNTPSTNWHSFIHLLANDGTIVAQQAFIPGQGLRPTPGWRPGEIVTDDYSLSLSPDLPPGSYTLVAGLFNPENFERPFVEWAGHAQPDNEMVLTTVTLP